jgi:hypothetical protein
MSSYFTTVIFENEQYFGQVFLSNTNQLIYTSKGYYSQDQAAKDARDYIIKAAPSKIQNTDATTSNTQQTSTSNIITSIATYKSSPSRTSGRCCGR